MSQTAPPPSLSTDQIDWLMVTANCLLTQKYPDRAAVLLEFLLCCEPENLRGQQMLGYCYYLDGRHEQALELFKALDPAFDSPVNTLLQAKIIAALGREDEAARVFDQFFGNRENAP